MLLSIIRLNKWIKTSFFDFYILICQDFSNLDSTQESEILDEEKINLEHAQEPDTLYTSVYGS